MLNPKSKRRFCNQKEELDKKFETDILNDYERKVLTMLDLHAIPTEDHLVKNQLITIQLAIY